MSTVRFEQGVVGTVLVVYVVLAAGFSLGPIFEGPDEIEHYRYVQTLVAARALPDPVGQLRGEYHQAPLYYLLLTPFAALIEDDDFATIDGRLNPYYGARIALVGNDNKNLYLHSHTEAFPYDQSATAASVHLMRLVSVLLGLGTLLVSRAIFRLLWPDQPALRLVALALVAFWPQFVYLSSVINNDALLIFLATLTLYWLLVLLRDGPARRTSILLGVTLGALLLTKVSAVFIAIPVGVALLLDRRAWRQVPVILLVVVGVAGWWYARNAILYGDPANTEAVLHTWESEVIIPGKLAFDIALERVPFAYETVWARFAQGSVPVTPGLYRLFDGLLIAAAGGLVLRLVQQMRARSYAGLRFALVIAVFALTWGGALFYWAATAWSGNQGRYLLPGIAALGAALAVGLLAWIPRRFQWGAALVASVGLGALTALMLFGCFLPAYQVADVPDTIDQPLSYRFGDVAELIGVAFDDPAVYPGDTLGVTLYWRALQPSATQLLVYLHSIDSDIVRRESYPGGGNLLATEWQAGDTWAEYYAVEIPRSAPAQTTYTLIAGLYDLTSETNLPVVDAAGQSVTPIIGEIGIGGSAATSAVDDLGYVLGNVIGLEPPRVTRQGDQLEVCLEWRALSRVRQRYTVFVHVLDSGLDPAPQADVQPPYPTDFWAKGDVVEQCITLTVTGLPEQGWSLGLGLYNATTMQRLPARVQGGGALPDDTIIVTP